MVPPARGTGRSRRPLQARRPCARFVALLGGLLLLLLALGWPAPRDLAPARAAVRWLALTDLCLTTESPATRNPALADPALPLQLVAGGLDLFPAPPFFDTTAAPAFPLGGRIAVPASRSRSARR